MKNIREISKIIVESLNDSDVTNDYDAVEKIEEILTTNKLKLEKKKNKKKK